MRIKPLLVAMLLGAGGPSLYAQDRLPTDWEKKVLTVVGDQARAKKISDAGRLCEVRGQQALAAVQTAHSKLLEVFLAPAAQASDRRISIQNFRDDRRNAAFLWIDQIYVVGELVTQKEWRAIWPDGFFAFPGPRRSVAARVQEALPSVVADPARKSRATEVAASLVKAANTIEASRKKAAGRLEKLLKEGAIKRDECIESVADLEKAQARSDEEFINDSGQLQRILTPDEWAALGRSLKATAR